MVDWPRSIDVIVSAPAFVASQEIAGEMRHFAIKVRGSVSKFDKTTPSDDETTYYIELFYKETHMELSELVALASSILNQVKFAGKEAVEKLRWLDNKAVIEYVSAVLALYQCFNFLAIGVQKDPFKKEAAAVAEMVREIRQYNSNR